MLSPAPPRSFRYLAATLALFSGVSLLLNILAGISLPLALGLSSIVVLALMTGVLRSVGPVGRRWIRRTLAAGALSGIVATISYDVTKSALSLLDPSPYNPFEAIRVFGRLLLGSGASSSATMLTGTGLHLLNGMCFGIAYTLLVAPGGGSTWTRAAAYGVSWALFLETFQLTLYPGWLNVRFYTEFATISALSHVVYGLTLAAMTRLLLGRFLVSRPAEVSPIHHAAGG